MLFVPLSMSTNRLLRGPITFFQLFNPLAALSLCLFPLQAVLCTQVCRKFTHLRDAYHAHVWHHVLVRSPAMAQPLQFYLCLWQWLPILSWVQLKPRQLTSIHVFMVALISEFWLYILGNLHVPVLADASRWLLFVFFFWDSALPWLILKWPVVHHFPHEDAHGFACVAALLSCCF